MQELKLTKGVAIMIRAILNIDPETLQNQVNAVVKMAEGAAVGVNQAVKDFDARLTKLEQSHNRIATMLERWDHERREFNAGTELGSGAHRTNGG